MSDLLDALSDEEVEALKDGETIRLLEAIRDSVDASTPPSSINVIEVSLKTEGLLGGVESVEQLPERFPDVRGLDEAVENYE